MDKQVVQHLPAVVPSIGVSAQVALTISVQSIIHNEAESTPHVLFFSSVLMYRTASGACKQAYLPAGAHLPAGAYLPAGLYLLLESWLGCLRHLPS
jgi:hypothetical protein